MKNWYNQILAKLDQSAIFIRPTHNRHMDMKTDTYSFHTDLYVDGVKFSFWFGNHHKRAILKLEEIKRGVK